MILAVTAVMILPNLWNRTETDLLDKNGEFVEERKFGYYVREELVERQHPLTEDDFKQLRKGQKIETFFLEWQSSMPPPGVIETVGMYDGEIITKLTYERYSFASIPLTTLPYYKIDENTYAILFFKNESPLMKFNTLERVEIWDAEGNRLRDIEWQ